MSRPSPACAHVRTAIISLGVNDGEGIATAENLSRLRGGVSADVVYWLLTGGNPRARDAVRAVAVRFGDRLIDVAPLTGAGPRASGPHRICAFGGETGGRGGGTSTQASAYRDFASPARVYRDFPNVKVWNGPENLERA